VFEIAAPIQSPAKCKVRSVIRFINAKGERPAEIHKLLLFMVMLWIGKMWRSGAVNSPKEGLMFTTNIRAVGHLWSPVWRNAPRILRDFGSALSFQTRLTQTKPVLPLSNGHDSQVKDQARWQFCH